MRNRYTPLIIIIVILIFFSLFIWVITRPSEFGIASDKINSADNIENLKLIWSDYKEHIIEDEDLKRTFESKIIGLNLSKSDEDDVAKWYPVRTHLNIVLVPDLSNRIINIPDQTKFDTTIIFHVWKCFQNEIKNKYKPGEILMDRLTVDVTDGNAAKGEFRQIANSLIFDVSTIGEKSPIVYLRGKSTVFKQSIGDLYRLGLERPLGADYKEYFDNRAKSNKKESTTFDRYRNIMILITDGYLEITGGPYYTGTSSQLNEAKRLGRPTYEIPVNTESIYSDWEVLVVEVAERAQGDYPILKNLWSEWFSSMRIQYKPESFFVRHNDASTKTKNVIEKFIISDLSKLMKEEITKEESVTKEIIVSSEIDNIDGVAVSNSGKSENIESKVSSLDEEYLKYIKLGDEKCEAFKKAKSPHLYHIANEYYVYAASLNNSTPKICE